MSKPILIVGESGSGKSRSTINLDPQKTVLIRVERKELPYRGWLKKFKEMDTQMNGNMFTCKDYMKIKGFLKYVNYKMPNIETIIIDDFQYLMVHEFMSQIPNKCTGSQVFDKYNSIGYNVYDLIEYSKTLRDDIFVVYMSHSDTDELGFTRCKTLVS